MRQFSVKFDDDEFPSAVISPEKEPVRARRAVAAYDKARRRGARCRRCLKEPRDAKQGVCGFCWYEGKERRQPKLGADAMCDDCAFRPDSPELRNGYVEGMIMRGPDQAPFLCHKPFLEPQQRWGMERGRIVLIAGAHWRMCSGFNRACVDGDLKMIGNLARAAPKYG